MYLITGIAGFIGSNLAEYLITQGEWVMGVDALKHGSSISNLQGCDTILHAKDIRDREALKTIFEQYPITNIIHLAAESHVDRSIENSLGFWKTNVTGTANLLECVRRHLPNIKSIVLQVTDEVYGPLQYGVANEGDQFNPYNPYSCSKVAQYWVGKSYYYTYGLPITFTFPVNNYGPRQYKEKLIPKFITKLIKGEKVPLMASTHYQRDWLPVEDMCSALYLLSNKGVPGEDYNIGAFNHKTNLEITHLLLDYLGRDESYIEIIPDRTAHDCRYAVSNRKIKQLGWSIKNEFEDYLKHTIEWYKARSRRLDNY